MIEKITYFKLIFLFMAVFFTLVNTARLFRKEAVYPFNFICQAVGIVGFVVIQFELWR
jgi:hypothetical protein